MILKIHEKLEINLEVQDETLLHYACKNGCLEVVLSAILKNIWPTLDLIILYEVLNVY